MLAGRHCFYAPPAVYFACSKQQARPIKAIAPLYQGHHPRTKPFNSLTLMKKLKVEELDRLSIEAFKTTKKIPLVIILDNVRSMHNVGAAFRTADAFLVQKLYLCGITAQPPHREIQKTALGATESVAWQHEQNAVALAQQLIDQGYQLIVAEQAQGSTPLQNMALHPQQQYALVFGNEVEGVNQALLNLAHQCVEIPQKGTKHSLNISVSLGIVLWQAFQQLYLKG